MAGSSKNKKSTRQETLNMLSDNAGIKVSPERFINRELSWLSFNERILVEARDVKTPLFERLKFLSITASNLDEFFVVRVASLKDMVNANYAKKDISGMTPSQQLSAIAKRSKSFMAEQYKTYRRSLLPALASHGIALIGYKDLTKEEKEKADDYYASTIYPTITPMAVDASRPFPLVHSERINLCVRVADDVALQMHANEKDPSRFATIQVPDVIPRLYRVEEGQTRRYVPIEQIICANIHSLFKGSRVLASGYYRIMRNADLDIDEDEAEDLLKVIEQQVKRRHWGEIIRLEVDKSLDASLCAWLTKTLEVEDQDIYRISGPLDLTFLMRLYNLLSAEYPELCDPHFEPQLAGMLTDANIFEQIRQKDALLHHPYEAFDPVIDLVRQASTDPNVLAIKQTLYRVSSQSPIIQHLATAAENGKQVMVLVELKARFDEENNIIWARRLEKAGCHVLYGIVGLKTHSKITLIVRREEDQIRRYLHLGTGNYNDTTAKIYTDIGLFTCSEPLGVDASEFFNMLSGYAEPPQWNRLVPAPVWLRPFFEKRIRREMNNANAGRKARIIAKINSLVDGKMIELLYAASQAGVKIDLIVRGICCLRAQVPGLSDNINVRSITGRFLEHSRIYYFYNEGAEDVYLSSADWMPRNLDRRIELLFPVEEPACIARVKEILDIELSDTIRSHHMLPDGSYQKIDLRGKPKIDSQIALYERAKQAAAQTHTKEVLQEKVAGHPKMASPFPDKIDTLT